MGLAVQQLAVDEGCHFLGGFLAIYFHCYFEVSSNSNGGKYSAFFEPVFAPRSLPACGTLVTFVCFHCSLHLFSDSLCFKHDFPLVIFVAVYIHDFMLYIFYKFTLLQNIQFFCFFTGLITLTNCAVLCFSPLLASGSSYPSYRSV